MFTKNRIYYQFKSDRLSACPLTAHELLHIPNDIQNNRPPCMNWTFVMECWCGLLLPAIKSQKKPFICLAFRQYQAAQYLASGNDVWSSLRLRELRKLPEAQGAMRASRAYREVIVSARARCH